MARSTIVTLVDDLDGTEKDVSTVSFGYNGLNYEIDLSPKNAEKLTKFITPYVEKARRTGKTTVTRTRKSKKSDA